MQAAARWYAQGFRSPAAGLLLLGHCVLVVGTLLLWRGWSMYEAPSQTPGVRYVSPSWLVRGRWHEQLFFSSEGFISLHIAPEGGFSTALGAVSMQRIDAAWQGSWSDWQKVRRSLYARAPQVRIESEDIAPSEHGVRVELGLYFYFWKDED